MAKLTAPPRDPNRLSEQELHQIDTYWRAANYLTIGQIYLLDKARTLGLIGKARVTAALKSRSLVWARGSDPIYASRRLSVHPLSTHQYLGDLFAIP